jgi:hypothetical protein
MHPHHIDIAILTEFHGFAAIDGNDPPLAAIGFFKDPQKMRHQTGVVRAAGRGEVNDRRRVRRGGVQQTGAYNEQAQLPEQVAHARPHSGGCAGQSVPYICRLLQESNGAGKNI